MSLLLAWVLVAGDTFTCYFPRKKYLCVCTASTRALLDFETQHRNSTFHRNTIWSNYLKLFTKDSRIVFFNCCNYYVTWETHFLTCLSFLGLVFQNQLFLFLKLRGSPSCDCNLAIDRRAVRQNCFGFHFKLEKSKKFVEFDQNVIEKTNIWHWQTEEQGKTLNSPRFTDGGCRDHPSTLIQFYFPALQKNLAEGNRNQNHPCT